MNIFQKLKLKLKGINPEKLIRVIRISIRVCQSLKMVVNNPSVSIIVALSKNKIDDKVLVTLKNILPMAINRLEVLEGVTKCSLLKDNLAVLQCIADQMKGLNKENKNFIYKRISFELTTSLIISEIGVNKTSKIDPIDIYDSIEGEYSEIKKEMV